VPELIFRPFLNRLIRLATAIVWAAAPVILISPADSFAQTNQSNEQPLELRSKNSGNSIQEFDIWPQGLPVDAVALTDQQIADAQSKKSPQGHIHYVESPTLSHYPADPSLATGTSVIICPGGGYHLLAWQHEGVELAEWFNSIGASAFILKYRVPRRNLAKIYWEPLQDIQRSMRIVRSRATEFGIDPNKIGVLGFSAGGHLTLLSGLQSELKTYEPVDAADQVSSRPDFICPIYAAYMAEGERDDQFSLGPMMNVTEEAPPTFMAVTWDDKFRGALAALLFVELKKNKVPAELHVFSKGGHGYGIRKTGDPVSQWHHLLHSWLKGSGFLE